jgi:tetratricopeptide (TPR) repeat protein
LAIPPTIHALLDARLDQLHASERAVIEPAAIVGKVFYERAVSELVPSDLRDTVAVVLDSLRRKDLIRPERASLGERAYRFRHLLIRDAAYDSIPKQTRAELHERFGRWLVRAAGTRAIEYEEVVGYHLEQAYRYLGELGALDDAARSLAREAAELLGSAGRRAFVRSDGPAGVNLISRAVTLLPPGDPLRVELIPNVRVVQGLATDLAWADRVLTEAIEAAATTGDSALGAHALVQQGLLRLFTGPDVTAAEMIEVAGRATTIFNELGDELGLARSWRLAAHAHYLARCARACGLASERALKHATAAQDEFEQREIIEALAIALLLGPEPASAAAARCRALSREFAATPLLQAEILAAQAPLEAMLGHTDKAAELIQRSNETVEPLNASIFRISLWRAFILLWLGDPAGAEDELLPAYHQLKLTGERSDFSSITQALAQARFGQGRHAEAEQLTHECEQACRPNDVHSQIGWRTIRAKTLAKGGQYQAAETLARSAVTYAETTDFLLSHADAATGLAEVLASQGRQREAIETTQLAICLYERKGNTLAAHCAAAMLAELTR